VSTPTDPLRRDPAPIEQPGHAAGPGTTERRRWGYAGMGDIASVRYCDTCGHSARDHVDEVSGHPVACTFLDAVDGWCGCGVPVYRVTAGQEVQ
jgi:hypothetical protein